MPFQDEIEFPCEIVAVADARAHALREEWWHLMGGITGQKYAPMTPLIGNAGAEDVIGHTDDLGIILAQISANARPNSFVFRCVFGRLAGVEHEREAMVARPNIDNGSWLGRVADLAGIQGGLRRCFRRESQTSQFSWKP